MKKWFIRTDNGLSKENFEKGNDISYVLARILANRGIGYENIDSFLSPSFDVLHDPFLMKDLEIAVDIIIDAIDNDKHIHIVGDYDQDGNSATVVLYKGLQLFTENLSFAIPHRVDDGYGISKGIVDSAVENFVDLIITCDNGISAFEVIDYANEKGIPVIVTDHHQVVLDENGEQILPKAVAVVNPQRKDCEYPFKALCGAGVAFKLMHAIFDSLGADEDYLIDLIQFVAMGTVCDVVDLVDENRFFVKNGLEIINSTDNIGLKELKKANGVFNNVNTTTLGFKIGPCINAAGRLDSAVLGVKLFLEEDLDNAKLFADELVSLNNERKELTNIAYENVINIIKENKFYNDDIIVVYDGTIHESIAGIVAGRVKDRFYRPTLVVTNSKEDGVLKGSARSIEGYNVVENLRKCSDLFEKFGGHTMAAGFSIKFENLDILRLKLNEFSDLKDDDFIEKIKIDMELPFKYINYDIVSELKKLEPFGKENPEAVFGAKLVMVKKISIIGKNKNVIRMELKQDNVEYTGIIFSNFEIYYRYLKHKFDLENVELKFDFEYEKGVNIDILFTPIINEYMNTNSIQLLIKDIR